MIVITGGAGFIGSALVWALNERGRKDLLIVDRVDHTEKEHNLAELRYQKVIGIREFRKQLMAGAYDNVGIEVIFHLGACSSTATQDWDYLLDMNVDYTKDILSWCIARGVRCLYASSAATYGDGAHGYRDDHALLDRLEPLNLYAKSKLEVDRWARDAGYLTKIVGLRYFNIFGPNENHKGDMRSVVAKKYLPLMQTGTVELFKSCRSGYADGEQKRDFLYVKDAVKITLFLWDTSAAAGVFNIGSGHARSWNDLARAMSSATRKEPCIRYIDMPSDMRSHYQYFTEADLSKLKYAGWTEEGATLEEAIADYVQHYLAPHKHLTPRFL